MNRVSRSGFLVLVGAIVGGCGGGGVVGGDGGGGMEASVPVDAGADLAAGGKDLALGPDLAMAPSGKRVFNSLAFITGITTDDQIIFDDGGGQHAVDVAGINEVNVDADSEFALVRGKVVFSWSNIDQVTSVANLVVWTAAAGPSSIATDSSAGVAAASDDGAWVLYTDKSTVDGNTAELWIAKIDGSGAKKLLALRTDTDCYPQARFGAGRFVFSYCDLPTDGGATGATVASLDPAKGTVDTLKTDASLDFFVDNKLGNVLVMTEAGSAALVPIAGGQEKALDNDVNEALFTPDGMAVVYSTRAGALKRSPTAVPAPTTLVGADVLLFQGSSPTLSHIIYSSETEDQSGNNYGDLFLASATAPGAATKLLGTITGGIYGDPFTADGLNAIYFTECDDDGVCTLNTRPAAGGAEVKLADTSWQALAVGAGKVVYNDNVVLGADSAVGDLLLKDLAAPATPAKLLTKGADIDLYLNTSKTKIIYTVSEPASAEGIYVMAVP